MMNLRMFIVLGVLGGSVAASQAALETDKGASSVQIETEKSKEERIAFLLDVGKAYMDSGEFEDAQHAYERVLALEEDNMMARYLLGHLYITTKSYAKAEKLILGLIEESPDDYKLMNNLAWLYATAEDPAFKNGAKAVQLAQEAIAIEPNDYHIWSTLAEAHYMVGQYEQAFRAMEQTKRLAERYAKSMTDKEIEEYNAQIRKCQRALETQKILDGSE